MTADVAGVVPRHDPTYDDRDETPDHPDGSDAAAGSGGAPTGRGGAGRADAAPLDARDRWILEQRPPHWG